MTQMFISKETEPLATVQILGQGWHSCPFTVTVGQGGTKRCPHRSPCSTRLLPTWSVVRAALSPAAQGHSPFSSPSLRAQGVQSPRGPSLGLPERVYPFGGQDLYHCKGQGRDDGKQNVPPSGPFANGQEDMYIFPLRPLLLPHKWITR